MAVIHILADGRVVDDIRGFVVKMEYAAPLYNLMIERSTTPRKTKKASQAATERGEMKGA